MHWPTADARASEEQIAVIQSSAAIDVMFLRSDQGQDRRDDVRSDYRQPEVLLVVK
jgi:hypothetical protein